MKNNNFKNLVIFAIIFQLLQEGERRNNTYNLINLSNPDKKERLIVDKKTNKYEENVKLKDKKRKYSNSKKGGEKQEPDNKNKELKYEKKQDNNNKELKAEKNEETDNKIYEYKKYTNRIIKYSSNILNKDKHIKKYKLNNSLKMKGHKISENNYKKNNIYDKKDKIIKNFKQKTENVKTKEHIFSKVPIVIANFETEIADRVFTKIENTFIDIKDVKNNIFIEESNLIKLDSNKGELFIKGYIRSYIEYVTLEKVSKSSITTKTEGIISHKDFRKAININLLFCNNMKRGKSFSVDFNNNLEYEEDFLGKIENLDIKSVNNYKDIQGYYFEREKCYLTLKQSLLIKAKINILQKNIVFL